MRGIDGSGEVLEDLVGVDDVEGSIGEGQRVDAGLLEGHALETGGLDTCLRVEHGGRFDVGADDLAGSDRSREPLGDHPRAATDIEQAHPGTEVGEEVRCLALGGADGRPRGDSELMTVRVPVRICGDRGSPSLYRRALRGVSRSW
jgi:hypothetical protein